MATAAAFKKHTHREHILEIPDTYIGSIDAHTEWRWIWDEGVGRMTWKQVNFCPGFYKLFDEVLVNALDHRVRLLTTAAGTDVHPVKNIWVTLEPERITVKNDGDGIPVAKHEKEGIYVPEMIFGHLLTSSNYNKEEEKTIGGKNGYGAKLANIFSKEFRVDTLDHRVGKKYKQVWSNNMTKCDKPSIVAGSTKPYTEISYVPDLNRFHWLSETNVIPDDMLEVMKTRVIDAAALAGKDCKVHLNGKLVAINSFQKYVALYIAGDDKASVDSEGEKKRLMAYERCGERWEVAAVMSRCLHGDSVPDERHISFVNGIATRRGGKHVEYVTKTALSDFCELAKKKAKLDVTSGMLKDSVVFFINSTIVNPAFDTQTKETLTTPLAKWGSKPEISSKFGDQLIKIGLLDEAQAALDAKAARDNKKTDGKKRSSVRGIPKLNDATFAGTAKSDECTLILTEGDSAATTAISGLKVVGRERYGVFPLRGKLLNVKDISAAKKTANQELTHIKQILGLVHGKTYSDRKQLRYGRIMIMTDQDVDGSHIKGLLINLFHTDWPSLLHLNFICCMMTPLLKATKGSKTLSFYSEPEFEAWRDAQGGTNGWKVKYYKGLGTSTATEAREYFAQMNTLDFEWDETADAHIDLAFNKKRADDRKTWLSSHDRNRQLKVTAGGAKVGYSKFINDELIHFSSADNIRSLPSVLDGLKPSQRKVLWASLKRNLVSEIKVAQLAGYVSETAAYHHGEMSLTSTIVGMAQDFVGSNNINLLYPGGQFGSRIQGGHDSASARYIFTHLDALTRFIYKKEDDGILIYNSDDGQYVEPENYYPIIPMLLVNGCVGIGTGFSTDIPSFNPADIVNVLKQRLTSKVHSLANISLTPWWHGFKGAIVQGSDAKTWTAKGRYTFSDDEAAYVQITELPVGTWSQDYREFLEEQISDDGGRDKKPLRDIENNCNDMDVRFTLKMDHDAYHEGRAYPDEFEKRFRLSTMIRTSNMVAFDSNGKIKRYSCVGDILEEFYSVRLDAYERRKLSELRRMDAEILELRARLKFIEAILSGALVVANVDDEVLLTGLKKLALPPLSAIETPDDLKAYEYLLRIRIDRIKSSAVAELRTLVANAVEARDLLASKSAETLWLVDLEAFDTAYKVFVAKKEAIYAEAQNAKVQTKVVKKPATSRVKKS